MSQSSIALRVLLSTICDIPTFQLLTPAHMYCVKCTWPIELVVLCWLNTVERCVFLTSLHHFGDKQVLNKHLQVVCNPCLVQVALGVGALLQVEQDDQRQGEKHLDVGDEEKEEEEEEKINATQYIKTFHYILLEDPFHNIMIDILLGTKILGTSGIHSLK